MEVKELIEMAYQTEEDAYQFYLKFSNIVVNPSAREMLKELAEEEKNHKNILLKYFSEKDVKIDNYPLLKIADHLPKKEKIDEHSDLKDILIYAIGREEKEFNFYNEMENHILDENIKNILDFLKNQEMNHKAKLENFYDELIYGEF
ncbi:MAG: ferritin family protein [Thermoplasmata archaeon]